MPLRGAAWRRLGNVDGFRLAAQQHQDAAAGGIEFDDHAAIGIDGPDIVLAVDADLLGDEKTVKSPADLSDEIAGGIELKQLCPAADRKGARTAQRGARTAGPREDEDIALGVGRDSGDLAEIGVPGQFQRIGGGERNFRRAFWAAAGSPTSKVAASRASKMRFTGNLPSDSYLSYCWTSYLGCRTNFCTRQDSISPTISWSGLRQSIACTTWKPGASLPAWPNLPSTVPSSSIL